ncbi:CD151 antigen [Habropoda laboriosa]|uniref:CD151 antigen n=1 Tax=Habropoda laboriosa TaxID=597456 RepID=A0A0L7R7N6_9HYME|nr:CD151 antigen [Habropoda laboriosa]
MHVQRAEEYYARGMEQTGPCTDDISLAAAAAAKNAPRPARNRRISVRLSGLVVGGIGIWTVISKHSYVSLMTTSTYPTLAYALIVAGVLAVVGSWLGCGGVTSENRCVLLIYVFVVMLVFVLEAGVGALARLYEEQVGPELKMNLNRTFLENYSMRSRETSAIDQMQIEFKCCGALRFEDWLVSEWHKDEEVLKDGVVVPESCCKTPTSLCGKRDHPSNIYFTVFIDVLFKIY